MRHNDTTQELNQTYLNIPEDMYTYEYPHPAVTADNVIFGFDGNQLHILLVERGLDPYKGLWALPGGFLRMDETIEQCAQRELAEETNVKEVYLKQFGVFSSVDRDPRERVVTVAFYALVSKSDYEVIAGDDASDASWFLIDEQPPLAFDHREIIEQAQDKLRDELRLRPIVFKLLDKKFSMSELQRLYELINETSYDRRNFQRKMMASGFLAEEKTSSKVYAKRRPQLFSFDEESYNRSRNKQERKKYPFDF